MKAADDDMSVEEHVCIHCHYGQSVSHRMRADSFLKYNLLIKTGQ